jgi:hypothetical protein
MLKHKNVGYSKVFNHLSMFSKLYKKSLTIRITLAAGAVVLQAFLVEKRRQEAVQDFG